MKHLKLFRLFPFLFFVLLTSCKKELNSPPLEKKPENSGSKITMVPSNGVLEEIKFGNGKNVKMYRIDTTYLIDGDILFTPHQISVLKQLNSGAAVRTYIDDILKYWPSGQVPFVINANFSPADQAIIQQAINHWETSTSIDFVARTSQPDFVEFIPSTLNNSFIGKIGGRQVINLAANGGFNAGSAIHEIGHAIGFFHEQSRTDRDNSIVINWNNIRPNHAFDFFTYADMNLPGNQIGSFDFNSIMLYPSFIFDPNFVFDVWTPVMQRLDGSTWWDSNVLSAGDIETSNLIYGPPFARLRYVLNSFNDNGSSSETIQDVYIDFFADAQCTQPVSLTTDRNITFKYLVQTTQIGSPPTYETTMIPLNFTAGNSSYTVGQVRYYEEHDGTWNETYAQNSYYSPLTQIMR